MKKKIKGLLIVLLLLALAGAGVFGYFYSRVYGSSVVKDTSINIETDVNMEDVYKELLETGAVEDVTHIRWLFDFKKITKPQKGKFFLKKGMSNNLLVNTIRMGWQTPVKVTFNNTRTLEDFAGKISKQIEVDSLELLSYLRDANVISELGFNSNNIIGMFIPNTYEVYYTSTPEVFVKKMKKEYDRFWNTERKNKAKRIGLTPQEVSTLAAIVDEETIKTDEKPRVAGVYINRLKKKMRLQADPTLKFAVGDFSLKRILNKHKEVESPYNTYKYAGLPPGPIRQPSTSGIEAVLNHEEHEYMYFCAKADMSGYHAFAKTLSKHNANARAYHAELNQRGIR